MDKAQGFAYVNYELYKLSNCISLGTLTTHVGRTREQQWIENKMYSMLLLYFFSVLLCFSILGLTGLFFMHSYFLFFTFMGCV